MTMTEEQAREKWCPFTRSMHMNNAGDKGLTAAYNRLNTPSHHDHLNPKSCRCIASDCMAWHWDEGEFGDRFVSAYSDEKETVTTRRTIKPDERVGYCGLAGADR